MLGDRIEALLADKSYNTAAIRGEIAAADVVVWGLYADPNTKLKAKHAGFYSCLSAEVIAGLSIGANALVGTQQEIALLPLKLDGQTGLNLAVGIASVTLAIAK